MSAERLRIVILGLSITSSWGNHHAGTYRALVRALVRRGHDVLFLERNMPWYEAERDLPHLPYGHAELYEGLAELRDRFTREIRDADLVMVGSCVPEGIAVGRWVTVQARGATAFYDIDTPATVAKLRRGDAEYLSRALVPQYDLYLSCAGGPLLTEIEQGFGAKRARALYCACDPAVHFPEPREPRWDLAFLGTYRPDRQEALEELLFLAARKLPQGRFAVAGPQYPRGIRWPQNIQRLEHLPQGGHRDFYNAQRFALHVTRSDRVQAGYSPSVRLFEAAACATAIISDDWTGIEAFFEPGREILIARSHEDTLRMLTELSEESRRALGERARARVLAEHTAEHRAETLEAYVREARNPRKSPRFETAQI
jgi:spore maturation protein CgeB